MAFSRWAGRTSATFDPRTVPPDQPMTVLPGGLPVTSSRTSSGELSASTATTARMRGFERARRGAADAAGIDPPLRDASLDQRSLRRARANDRGSVALDERPQSAHQREPVLSLPFRRRHRAVCDDEDARASRSSDVRIGRDARSKALDWPGLLDVERLAGGDRSGAGRIDEAQLPHAIPRSQPSCYGRTELARADDCDKLHQWSDILLEHGDAGST